MREWLSGGVSPCQGEGRGASNPVSRLFLCSKAAGLSERLPLFFAFENCNDIIIQVRIDIE